MGTSWREPTHRPAPEHRAVVQYATYDTAQRDARLRGACIVLDAHFRFWSTPSELTLLEVHSQMFRQLFDELTDPPDPLRLVISTPSTFGNPAA